MLAQARLKELLHYDPLSGLFTFLARPRIRHGKVSGSLRKDGYITICVDKTAYLAHRLAWFYMTGAWPKKLVDHIDGLRANNIFMNLREANHILNAQNLKGATKASSTGKLGVNINGRRFQAKIKANGQRINLGTFDTPELAHDAYLIAKRKLHIGGTL